MSIIRTIAERVSRGKRLKRTLTVLGKPTPLYVSPDSQLKYLKIGSKAFDRDLILIAENFLNKNSVVWDIGANVGVFTFASASVATEGTIVAIEADTWLVSILRKSANLATYRSSDIRIVPTAVSDSDSVAAFMIARRGRASNALKCAGGRSQMGGVREIQHVPTLRLDTLLSSLPEPHFIKIDVEGAELMVLNGGSKMIEEIRPVFYIEVGSEVDAEVLALFGRHGYLAVSPAGEILNEHCAPNTFFIPKENQKALQAAGVDMARLASQALV